MYCFGLSFIQIQAEQLFHSWKMAIWPRQSGWSLRWLLLLLLGIGFEFWFFTANKKIHPGSMILIMKKTWLILICWKTPKERPKKEDFNFNFEWMNKSLPAHWTHNESTRKNYCCFVVVGGMDPKDVMDFFLYGLRGWHFNQAK